MARLLKPGAYVPQNPHRGWGPLILITIGMWAAMIAVAMAAILVVDVLAVVC